MQTAQFTRWPAWQDVKSQTHSGRQADRSHARNVYRSPWVD